MNINTEKQNMFSLSAEPEAYSPYLSPLIANSNSKDFEGEEQLIHFQLNEPQLEQNQSVHKQNDLQLDMDLLIQYRSTPEADLMEESLEVYAAEKKTTSISSNRSVTNIQSIINFLVDHDELSEAEIKQSGRQLYQDSEILENVFNIMMTKLKKLRKTKQEMTKFCMRKAFKFVSDEQSLTRKKRKSSKEEQQNDHLGFEMPFRKNSTQKTMNAQFLKQVFSRQGFVQQYHKFLQQFNQIIHKDNQYKIKYLADMIQQYMKQEDSLKKIGQIKRLPWTRSILNKTEQLAYNLLKFSEGKDDRQELDKQ